MPHPARPGTGRRAAWGRRGLPPGREGQRYGVGASIGLVAVNGTHASAAEVLRAADAACYTAKREGRNRVSIASH
ncbi:MAG: diguanylate cyclase [Rubrivivax sp.]